VALDRQSIEKRDFPLTRRGYDPDAVHEHLARLAAEVQALQRSSPRGGLTGSRAGAASDQVRVIVEAAEHSAEEIGREAELEADRLRDGAREAATVMLGHAEALESEFGAMLESVRTGAARLRRELEELDPPGGEETSPAAGGAAVAEPAVNPSAPHIPVYEAGMLPGAPEFAADPEDGVGPGHPGPEPEAPPAGLVLEEPFEEEPVATAAPAAAASGAGDEEGARLIALNMALNGTPREETRGYLADTFRLTDTERMLDDVYARAEQ